MRIVLSFLILLQVAPPLEASLVKKTGRILSSPFRINKTLGLYFAGLGFLALSDEAIESGITREENGEAIFKRITFMGRGEVTFGIGGLSYGLGYVLKDEKLSRTGRLTLESNVITGLITTALKAGLGRYRPFSGRGAFAFKPFRALDASFPSGHTSMVFSVATVFASQYSSPVPEIAYMTASLVGLSRIYLSRHWSTDVWTGAFLGWAVGKAVVWLDRGESVSIYPACIVLKF